MNDLNRLFAPVSERDHSLGRSDVPLTLVEYGDYQCRRCGVAAAAVARLQRTFGRNLRFVFRNFPLVELHPYALLAAEAAEAAAYQGKFWEMHDVLFDRQKDLAPGVIGEWATSVGVDAKQMGTDIGKGVVEARILADRRGGAASGVDATPAFFINGGRHDEAADYDYLAAALESVLEPHRV
jgi:protein-disulfide isomerase